MGTHTSRGSLLINPVAVEKLDLSKLVEETLRYEALQTTFLIFLDIFYPPNCCCFEKNGVFQQPRLVTTVNAGLPDIQGLSQLHHLRVAHVCVLAMVNSSPNSRDAPSGTTHVHSGEILAAAIKQSLNKIDLLDVLPRNEREEVHG